MSPDDPEARARRVLSRCSSCGHCRELMDDASCLFMPELYRLADREAAGGEAISEVELKALIGLCNACGICPCAPVQAWINEARDAFVNRDGLASGVRLLENVQRLGQIGEAVPHLANALTGANSIARTVRRIVRIHPERKVPRFPIDGFSTWARARGLHGKPRTASRKIAYFVGCTARYFFPEVAKATVEVLERNGVAVHLPEQKCCGMPALLEGDRSFTFDRVRFNVEELARCVEEGFDIVCSCPTCGYLLKSLLRDGAEYSEDYRSLVAKMIDEAGGDMGLVSQRLSERDAAFTGNVSRRAGHGRQPWLLGLVPRQVFQDQGYFSALSGLARLRVANHTYDLGEYLSMLHQARELALQFGAIGSSASYFAPCHQRQQGIGQPWKDLLGLIPGLEVARVGDGFDCCGQGGLMGFKQDFHVTSLRIGQRLTEKIRAAAPECLVTDCLSCRIQFEQVLSREARHPVELLRDSYRAYRAAMVGEIKGEQTHECRGSDFSPGRRAPEEGGERGTGKSLSPLRSGMTGSVGEVAHRLLRWDNYSPDKGRLGGGGNAPWTTQSLFNPPCLPPVSGETEPRS
ncbi:heterodisulfide reductase-related iron-sulfur binding cluster [Propionivibrio soli]|uniref:heterodisulfide reductase-related iron-sulfur binding cluster n=1 Tax=Propionivibrio soli TaxID=2976531 RepID=UPI0021E87978|nr:heterodisulfide reductase-related iron-sulfur binding cluster [Propionivibrio soli]